MDNKRELRDLRKTYERKDRVQERPKLLEYNLSIELAELVGVLKGMEETVKWPPKMKYLPEVRDIRKWYKFHQDHGHRIDECHAL